MKFLRQDYFRHKRLGRKWRKPKGSQSKMRKSKGGSGKMAGIGYGSHKGPRPVIIRNTSNLESIAKGTDIIIAAGIGARKAYELSEKASKLGLKVVNRRKTSRAEKIFKKIEAERKKKEAKKTESKKTKTQEEKKEAKKPEPKTAETRK